MNITSSAFRLAKSDSEMNFPVVTSGNMKSGAGVPGGNIVEGVSAMLSSCSFDLVLVLLFVLRLRVRHGLFKNPAMGYCTTPPDSCGIRLCRYGTGYRLYHPPSLPYDQCQ